MSNHSFKKGKTKLSSLRFPPSVPSHFVFSPLPWEEQKAPRQGKISATPALLAPAALEGPLGWGKPDMSVSLPPPSKALAEPMMHI